MADRFGASDFIAAIDAVSGAIADPTERNKDVGSAMELVLVALFLGTSSRILQ